jgi:arsenite methyltransferase
MKDGFEETTGRPAPADDTPGGCCAPGPVPEVSALELREVSREDVRAFYGDAARNPTAELCCPTAHDPDDLAHIPEEVLAVSFGCGSPMSAAAPRPGETVVDLGSGGGIDCFIAAARVGPEGRVIGIDMTDEMLATATANAGKVAARLGYGNVAFAKGYLEDVPVPDGTADLVTSNCVLNLSTDKPRVFREIRRVLRDGGRFVIADIVADRPVPEAVRADRDLWGACLAGAMTERTFAEAAEQAGFHGITLERGALWREAAGVRFYSTTFRGLRHDKASPCVYRGQQAIYLGPARSVTDDDGHVYLRGEAVDVCTDTAARLAAPPYAGMFWVGDPTGAPQKCC